MALKTKLAWGLGFLFIIIFVLGGICSYYVGKLSRETDNILKNNYNSIVYAKNMLSGLDDMETSINIAMLRTNKPAVESDYYRRLFNAGKKLFEDNLKAARNNVTEIHEKEYVDQLNQNYDMFLSLCHPLLKGSGDRSLYFSDFLPAYEKMKHSVNTIYEVNMQAVVHKSNLAKTDSARFLKYMAMIGAICLVLALGYFWYFPTYISLSLNYLADRMKNLLKNIGITMDLKTNDESNVILQGIILLENKLNIKDGDTNLNK
jgi:hypothetical protein